MDIHASPTTLPELEKFLSPFQVRFRRPEGEAALERSLTGLLTALPKKHCDPMAEAVPGTSEQRLQEVLTNMHWDDQDRNRQRVEKRIAAAPLGNGGLLVDDTGFAKQGKASVGVARQYSGTLGKGGNCQGALTCYDDAPPASWPVAVRLSLPQEWTADAERLQRARVPSDVTFQTTPQIALALLDQARSWGVPHRGVVTDAASGDHPPFLSGLEKRPDRYVVAIRCDFQGRPQCRGAPPSQRADQVLAPVPRRQWRTLRWRPGTKGGWRKQCVAVRAWRLTAEGEVYIGWVLGERAARGQPEEPKCSWSTLPASATWEELVDYAHRRHAIEQFHEEAKEEGGWDQYQGRLWPGFHRQAVTGMLAWSFLRWLERRQRHNHPTRGRPRAPFSPAAGSVASRLASGASGGGAVAAPPSRVVVDHHGSVHGTVLTENLTK
jgi:SRSO17 transposase